MEKILPDIAKKPVIIASFISSREDLHHWFLPANPVFDTYSVVVIPRVRAGIRTFTTILPTIGYFLPFFGQYYC
jgi:hypothetical protein